MTRLSFSAKTNTLNFQLPTGWHELDQRELHTVLTTMAEAHDEQYTRVKIIMRLTGLRVLSPVGDGHSWLCVARTPEGNVQCHIPSAIILALTDSLAWLSEPGNQPVRYGKIGRAGALHAKLHGVPFETYLTAENCYQGVLDSKSPEAIQALAEKLYPGLRQPVKPDEQLMLLLWWQQLKAMFAGLFPSFFHPAEGGAAADMMQIMNNQIRALTGGDVTKETEILGIDTWRALTELDAKAREADDFKRKMNSKK